MIDLGGDGMIYKEDWDRAMERLKAWLSGEIIDRVVIQVTAPRKGTKPSAPWNSWSLIHNLDDTQEVLWEFEKRCKETYFGGEAFPNLWINLGPGIPAAYLGCPPQIVEDTVWFEAPQTRDWDDILNLELDAGNEWWKITKDITSQAVEYGKGKFFVSVTDLNAVMNILGSLRGTGRLLMDLVDYPHKVKEASSFFKYSSSFFKYSSSFKSFSCSSLLYNSRITQNLGPDRTVPLYKSRALTTSPLLRNSSAAPS